MRKYQQLVIVSLGLVSFICFLIYKHEYDRLKNVLQVLEVFGTPPPVIKVAPGMLPQHSLPSNLNQIDNRNNFNSNIPLGESANVPPPALHNHINEDGHIDKGNQNQELSQRQSQIQNEIPRIPNGS